MSSVFPLKTNEEVRAGTCSPFIWLNAVHKSSVTPSLKYSFSLSGLMLTNGSTATDLAVDVGLTGGAWGAVFNCRHQTRPPITASTNKAAAVQPSKLFRRARRATAGAACFN